MQTFLPYPDFEQSARCLDYRRLNKQRMEVVQLLRALSGETEGWASHPAAKMWEGYTQALCAYGEAICLEWITRGYNDRQLDIIEQYMDDTEVLLPFWFGNPLFHDAHKSNLLRKDPEFYAYFAEEVPDNLEYIWPTDLEYNRTTEVLNLYKQSEVHYLIYKYVFLVPRYNFYITPGVFNKIEVFQITEDGVVISNNVKCNEIDQDHPEIVKIRKRLEFLNSL